MSIESFVPLFAYNDAENHQVFSAALTLSDAQLDDSIEMGFGSLRKTLEHIQIGETVWLARWQGLAETPWPASEKGVSVADLLMRLTATAKQRLEWLDGLSDAALDQRQTFRDSKGSLFEASLVDMLRQGVIHSIHHRAQAVNMIRPVSGNTLEMDYMVFVRKLLEEGGGSDACSIS